MSSTLIDEIQLAASLPSPAGRRLIRDAAGATRAQVAREVGVHEISVARWEGGKCEPRGSIRLAYARLLRELQDATTEAGAA